MYADRDEPTQREPREASTLQFNLVNKYLGDGEGSMHCCTLSQNFHAAQVFVVE